jgi:hypothetical protein
MSLLFEIDIDQIAKELKDTSKQLADDLMAGAEGLALSTHLKVLELSDEKLGSLSEKYKDNVTYESPMRGLWIVTLKEPALFIEDSRRSGFMRELLEGKSARTSKDGSKYAIIPFHHDSKPSQTSHKAQEFANQLKDEFKKRDIPWKNIEMDENGSPRMGVVHRFDVESARPTKNSKFGALHGITVMQNKNAEGGVDRSILTFRTISEKSEQEGSWFNPGREGSKLFDTAGEWCEKEWEEKILPEILSRHSK